MSALTFLHGMIAMACFVVGLVFLKYWRLTREHTHYLYLPRLAGFLMILIAILLKNRRPPD